MFTWKSCTTASKRPSSNEHPHSKQSKGTKQMEKLAKEVFCPLCTFPPSLNKLNVDTALCEAAPSEVKAQQCSVIALPEGSCKERCAATQHSQLLHRAAPQQLHSIPGALPKAADLCLHITCQILPQILLFPSLNFVWDLLLCLGTLPSFHLAQIFILLSLPSPPISALNSAISSLVLHSLLGQTQSTAQQGLALFHARHVDHM